MSVELKADEIEFITIKGFPRYAINRHGAVIDLEANTFLNGWISNGGYINYNLHRPAKLVRAGKAKRAIASAHRLVAETFIPTDKDKELSVVNHLDGNKFNNHYINLEWCTYQENQWHAGEHGLTTKCQPITVLDIDDLGLANYPSILEYSKVLGVSKDIVSYWVKKCDENPKTVTPFRSQIRIGSNAENWMVPESINSVLADNGTSVAVNVRFLTTGEVREFPQLTELARFLGVALPTLSQWYHKPNQPTLPGLLQIKTVQDTNDWRDVDDPYLELMVNFPGYKVIKVKDLITQQITVFEKAILCANAFKLKPNLLDYYLNVSKSKVYRERYEFAYYQNDFIHGLKSLDGLNETSN